MYIIYKTTNIVNDKIYVGLHKQDGVEFDGYLGSGLILKKAIVKYGRDAFVRETLAVCETKAAAAVAEKHFINVLDSRNPIVGYNITAGGIGGDVLATHPDRHNIMARRAITIQNKIKSGQWTNPIDYPGAREKQRESLRRIVKEHPEYWDKNRGPRSEAHRALYLTTFSHNKELGLHQDPAITSAHRSQSQLNRFATMPESHGMLGMSHTNESRAKISQTRKERFAAGTIIHAQMNVDLVSGENNYQFKGWYSTPWGTFASIKAASTSDSALITDATTTTIRKIFNNLDAVASSRSINTIGGVKGQTWRQLGFVFVSKCADC